MRAFFSLAVAVASFLGSYATQDLPSLCTLRASGGDDGPAFVKAVKACPITTIPKGATLNVASKMNMTGLSDRIINLQGTVRFNPDVPFWTAAGNAFFFQFQNQTTFWILGGKNILLTGGGTLDGAGQAWWDAFATNSTLQRPIILTLFQVQNAVVQGIKMINSPEWFNLVNEGENVLYDDIDISAVSTSTNFISNTDGWDIYRSNNVRLQNSKINNGDDCVSFKPNATNIIVNNLNCNGSHGISVGSLGQFAGMFDIVENVTSTNVVMSNAQNGARIKAWAGAGVGAGSVKNIVFKNFTVSKVDNPVVIDQCYMTNATACAQFPSNVDIQNVQFDSVHGTSSGATVASLKCSPDGRCSDISVNDLELMAGSGTATYACQNVVLEGDSAVLFPNCTVT